VKRRIIAFLATSALMVVAAAPAALALLEPKGCENTESDVLEHICQERRY